MKRFIGVLIQVVAISSFTFFTNALTCKRNSLAEYHLFSHSQVEFLGDNETRISISSLQNAPNSAREATMFYNLPNVIRVRMHYPRVSFTLRRAQLTMSADYKMIVFNGTRHREVPSSLRDSCLYSTENGSAHGVSAILNLCSERLLMDVLIGRRSYAVLPSRNKVSELNESFCIYVKYHNRVASTPEEDLGDSAQDSEDDSLERPFNAHSLAEAVVQQVTRARIGNPTQRVKRSRVRGIDAKVYSENYFIVELVVVVDHFHFEDQQPLAAVEARVGSIINRANDLFRNVNVILALVGLIVWKQESQISYPYDRNVRDEYDLFRSLGNYKVSVVNDMFNNDALLMITGAQLPRDSRGFAVVGTICASFGATGISTDLRGNPYEAAASAATHMISHMIGVLDDGPRCQCEPGSGQCIMSPNKQAGQTYGVWSDCSLERFSEIRTENHYEICLRNFPTLLNDSTCGNSFVENDEECDCGPVEMCTNPCCNPAVCRRKLGAQCAHGGCCDLDECRFRAGGTVCRNATNEECDYAETCSGSSSDCPEDKYANTGTLCTFGDEVAYCFQRSCTSLESRCQYLFGPSARLAPTMCFDLNTAGKPWGACRLIHVNETAYESSACEEADKRCGQIHCLIDPYATAPPMPVRFFHYVSKQGIERYQRDGVTLICPYVFFRFDYGIEFVPEGARCGVNKHCRDRKCVDLPATPSTCPRGTRRDRFNACVSLRRGRVTELTKSGSLVASVIAMTLVALITKPFFL